MDLSTMTLADAEALAGRLETAARTIRDAMALMGGKPKFDESASEQASPALVRIRDERIARDVAERSSGVLMTNKGPVALTAEEQARKAAMRAERLAALPDNVREIEEKYPEEP